MKIAIIGAGLSGLAAAWRLRQMGHEVSVFETADHPGGRCATVRRDGFIIDTGPDVVSGSYVRWQRLARDMGLGNDIIPSSSVIAGLRHGRMIDIDTTKPLSLVFTPYLSAAAKLRLAKGLFQMRHQLRAVDSDHLLACTDLDNPERTAEDVAVTAFGREAAEYLIDPMMRTLGGSRMSTVSPLVVYYGLRGFSQPMLALRGGLDRLPFALAQRVPVRYRARVTNIRSEHDKVSIDYIDENAAPATFNADRCLITTQYDDAARLYPRLMELGGDYGRQLKFAKLLDIKLAYGKAPRSKACVAQVPTIENRELLLFLMTHNKAPDRAPPGHSLFTVYSEHFEYERLAAMSNDDIVSWARGQMERLYPEIAGSFLFGFVLRQPRTVCFSDPGYYRRTAKLWDAIGTEPRVHLGGDMMNGGSMEAAVVGGERAAERLVSI